MIWLLNNKRAQMGSLSALVVLLVLCSGNTFVKASLDFQTMLEQDLSALPATLADEVRQMGKELEQRGLSLKPLQHKLREGLTKSILPVQIVSVLGRMTENLIWLDEQIGMCACARSDANRALMLTAGNDALLGTLSKQDLAAAIKTVCHKSDGQDSFVKALDFYTYLTSRLRAKPEAVWNCTLIVLKRGESPAAYNKLILVLQDVFKSSGNIDSALAYMAKQLNGGLALRAVTHEIREQFSR